MLRVGNCGRRPPEWSFSRLDSGCSLGSCPDSLNQHQLAASFLPSHARPDPIHPCPLAKTCHRQDEQTSASSFRKRKEKKKKKPLPSSVCLVFASAPLGLLLVSSASPAHHMHAVEPVRQEWTNPHVAMLLPCSHPHRETMALPGLPGPQHGLVRPKLPCSWARPSHADPDPLAPCTWPSLGSLDAGRTSPGTLVRPSPAGLSFSSRPGTSSTQGLQEQTRDQAELPRRPLAR